MRNLRRTAVPRRSAALFTLAMLLASPRAALAQTITGTVVVRVTADSMPISGATIAAGTANGATDRSGLATFTLPGGRRTFRVTSAGFLPESVAVNVGSGMNRVAIALHHQVALPDGLVATRRDVRRGADEPTQVDVTDRDALDEQIDRSPGSVSDLLAHIDGVRVQPFSAGSAGAGIRIRGMPGRYTKILMDGLPLFGATSQGAEPLQTPALGLQRVEVIKGVTSALYGTTALSGVVNMVSAPPTSPSEVVVNGSTQEASDVAIWQTHTFSPEWSGSLVAGRHYENPGDPDGDGWAEVAGYKRIVVRPRVYWARSDRSAWFMTGGWTSENRRSGTFGDARLPDFNRFSDDADTRRADAGTVGRILLDTNMFLTVRASMTREWRTRWYGENRERDRRNAIFSDVAVTKTMGANVVVGGVSIERDQYAALDMREASYRTTTPALFAEHTWTPEHWFALTSGARLDLQSEFGDFLNPRMSVVVRPSDTWTARLSAATGVYAPTPLTDETEGFGLSHLRATTREAEHATGWSLDLDRVKGSLELRGAAYRTVVNHPLVLRTAPGSPEEVELVNAEEPTRTQGIDLSARYRMQPLRLTASYSYIDATRPMITELFGDGFSFDTTMRRAVPLNPRHAVNLEAAHERVNDRIMALALHVVGRQTLSDTLSTTTQAYVTVDARFEKHVGRTVLFVGGTNLTGVHQTQFLPVLLRASGPSGQWTGDVWAPLGGRAINAGLRLKY
jgi:outer membrane receptor for ferrienterochelin and colicins